MSEGNELSISQLRRKRGDLPASAGAPPVSIAPQSTPGASPPRPAGAAETTELRRSGHLPFDPARVVDAWARRYRWLVVWAALGALVGSLGGWLFTPHIAEVRMVPRDTLSLTMERSETQPASAKDRSQPTVVELIHTPEILARAGAASQPPVSPAWLAARVRAWREGASGPFVVRLEGRNPTEAVGLANLCATALVSFTREMQTHELTELNGYMERKLAALDAELKAANEELAAFNQEANVADFDHQTEADLRQLTEAQVSAEKTRIELETTNLRIATLRKALVTRNPRLVAAQAELNTALLRFTEAHPRIKELRSQIDAMEKETKAADETINLTALPAEGTLASHIYLEMIGLEARKAALARELEAFTSDGTRLRDRLAGLSAKGWRHATLKARRESLEESRRRLAARHRELQLVEESSQGTYRILAPATLESVLSAGRGPRIAAAALGSAAAALLLTALLVAGIEVADPRLKTRADLERVTRLHCLASLGDLRSLEDAALDPWALQTWAAIKGQLRRGVGEALICGITSSSHGEGRSTWVSLVAAAASKCGLEVLTVTLGTQPSAAATESGAPGTPAQPETAPADDIALTLAPVLGQESGDLHVRRVTHADVPVTHGAWGLSQRRQWDSALAGWRGVQDLVVLVDLPPACAAEAVAVLETIPNVIWLSAMGEAKAGETRRRVDTLRRAGCNLVGTVMNRERTPFWKNGMQTRLERWLLKLAGCLLVCAGNLHGAEAEKPADSATTTPPQATPAAVDTHTNTSFSVPPHKRAPWQEKLTLGPGDVLSVAIYGQADSIRSDVVIGPDGRLSYLQAQDLPATGLTVDELRTKLDDVLGKFYRSPRTIVTPLAFRSKRFYLLGSVARQGVYPLNRPITIIEALAQAHGFALPQDAPRNALELADLQRSFLARKGARVNVDFEKLFLEGDLTQNIGLEPDDYLYFPPMDMPEVYVLGAVRQPGAHAFVPGMSVLRAITVASGFTDRAYRQRVLVVRGSLSKPETFIINSAGALQARNVDFRLNPRDIIYVNERPWIRAEDLLDYAATSFINAALVTWTGKTVGPFIER